MDELIEHLGNIYSEVFARTDRLRFEPRIPQQLYSVCLHGSILEIASGSLALLKANECSVLPGLVRNLLEAYVDLVNLCKCPEYINRMQAAFLNEQSRILKAAIESGDSSPYLEALAKAEGLREHDQKVEEQLEDLRSRGLGPLKIKERFDRAGIIQMYESVYALLCQHSHNNLNILERRHLEVIKDDYRVSYFQAWDRGDVLPYVETIAVVLVDSLRKLTELLKVPKDIDFETVEKSLASLRKTY